MDIITVHILHPTEDRRLDVQLPRNTEFSALTPLLYERKFIEPQKPGYLYLYQEHLCGMRHTLGDYIPESAAEMELKVFHFPAIMV